MNRFLISVVAVVCLCSGARSALASDAIPGIGTSHTMSILGIYGSGKRFGGTGSSQSLRFEGAAYFLHSLAGNLGGMEGGIEIGRDALPRSPTYGLDGESLMMDLWLGFPITLLNLGKDEDAWLRIGLAPGIGFSFVQAYAYLKPRLAVRIVPDLVDLDVSWFWIPGAAMTQSDASKNDSLATSALRASVFVRVNRDVAVEAFGEWRTVTRELQSYHDGASKAVLSGYDTFGTTARSQFEQGWRLGVGAAF